MMEKRFFAPIQENSNGSSSGDGTTPEHSSPSSSLEQTPSDFSALAQKILRLIERKNENTPVEAYPEQHETTSKGVKLLIDTLMWEQEGTLRSSHGSTLTLLNELVLTATEEETGKIVGLRSAQIAKDPAGYDWELIMESTINVRERDKGIATALANASLKNIQQLANEKKASVTWLSSNANLSNLMILKEQKKVTKNENTLKSLTEKIAVKEAEQARWQNLYGPEGKVKLEPIDSGGLMLKKTFMPNETPVDEKKIIDAEEYQKIINKIKECSH